MIVIEWSKCVQNKQTHFINSSSNDGGGAMTKLLAGWQKQSESKQSKTKHNKTKRAVPWTFVCHELKSNEFRFKVNNQPLNSVSLRTQWLCMLLKRQCMMSCDATKWEKIIKSCIFSVSSSSLFSNFFFVAYHISACGLTSANDQIRTYL